MGHLIINMMHSLFGMMRIILNMAFGPKVSFVVPNMLKVTIIKNLFVKCPINHNGSNMDFSA